MDILNWPEKKKKKKKETMFKISLRKTSEPVTITATINFASFQLEVWIAAETGNVEELSTISWLYVTLRT